MNKKVLFAIISAVLIVLIVGAVCLYDFLSADLAPSKLSYSEDDRRIDFKMETADGETVKLSDFDGRPIVLNFWSTTCAPCKNEMPAFNDAYGKYKGQVEFVMVNLDGSGEDTTKMVSDFIKSSGYSFPVYFDTEGEGARAYEVYYIPQTYFIDHKGTIVTQATGAMNRDTLEQGIEMILK